MGKEGLLIGGIYPHCFMTLLSANRCSGSGWASQYSIHWCSSLQPTSSLVTVNLLLHLPPPSVLLSSFYPSSLLPRPSPSPLPASFSILTSYMWLLLSPEVAFDSGKVFGLWYVGNTVYTVSCWSSFTGRPS